MLFCLSPPCWGLFTLCKTPQMMWIPDSFQVKFSVFISYLKSVGPCATILSVIFIILMESCTVGTGLWLAYWSSANITTDKQRNMYIGIYGGIGLGQGLFTLLFSISVTFGSMVASRRLHNRLLLNIMHSPLSFFDTTPLGRIVNRFSKDLYTIDDTIPRAVTDLMWCMLDVIGMIVAISYATPLFLAVLPVLGAFYLYIQVSKLHLESRDTICFLFFFPHHCSIHNFLFF